MSTVHLIVTVLGAAMAAFSAASLYARVEWVTKPLTDYGVPRSWWPWLATAKAAGAVGLLVGLAEPAVGIAAGIGLVVYFLGAVVTVTRARWFAHIPYPLVYLTPVAASLALGIAA